MATGTRTMPIGTFSQKIQCQEMPCTTAPPTSGPIATAVPEMPDHTPSASPAAFGGEGVGQQRERERRDDRGAGALDGARGDQQIARRRQRGGGGGGGEHRRARSGTCACARSGRPARRR